MIGLTIILILFFKICLYLYLSTLKPKNFPPGPKCVPLMGSVPALKRTAIACKGRYKALEKLAADFNTRVLGLKLGSENFAVIFSYPLVRHCLLSDAYDGRPDNFFNVLRSMGRKRGITSADGEAWKINRSFVLRQLAKVGFGRPLMETMILKETEAILAELERTAGTNMSMGEFIAPSVLNVLWHFTCGKRMERTDPKLVKFLEILRTRSKLFDMSGGLLNYFPFLRFIAPDKTGYNLLVNINVELKRYFVDLIEEHKANWTEGRDEDVIYAYLSEINKEKSDPNIFNEDELIMVCLDLFFGGSDTTSSGIDFLILNTLLYPETKTKLLASLDQVFDRNQEITYADRVKVPYVEAFIAETQRILSVIPTTGPRKIMQDTVLDGYHLPKNTSALISLQSIHMDPELWPEPDQFRPERFLDKDGNLTTSEHFAPYGLGRRRCLGEALARSALFTIFTNIIHKFDVAHGGGKLSKTPMEGITYRPVDYSVTFSKRV